jgi:2-amino-4-hydroxy-6-hydroxymethyldihydropteridine diphosphokinase
VALLLGSNVGNRASMLLQAVERLSARAMRITAISDLYETAAWGNTEQAAFYNCAVTGYTPFTPHALLKKILEIEREMGRERLEKWGPRSIDIDILLYAKKQVRTPDLQIPHPQMQLRRFALEPLAEIAGNMWHPVLRESAKELLAHCPDELRVIKTGLL